MSADTYALDIDWGRADLPTLVGPFGTRLEAEEWAKLNIRAGGTWDVRVLAYPYYQRERS
jgi:hypothetical protein